MSSIHDNSRHNTAIPLSNFTPIKQSIVNYLETKGKKFPLELYLKYGAVQGMLKNLAVVGLPMHSGDWHCINYETYPSEPRFLNASQQKVGRPSKAKLGLLGTEFHRDSSIIFLTEGIWDMLTLASQDAPVWGLPGVNNFSKDWLPLFKDKTVYICFDQDEPNEDYPEEGGPGQFYASRHAQLLTSAAKKVYNIILPKEVEGKKIKDVSDLFNAFEKDKAADIFNQCIDEAVEIIPTLARDEIHEVLLSRGNGLAKATIITTRIIEEIEKQQGSILTFNNQQELFLAVEGKEVLVEDSIDRYLKHKYNFLDSHQVWRDVRGLLYNHALRQSKDTEVHFYSAYRNGKVYIGLKNQGVLVVDEDSVSIEPQGVDGIYIKSGNIMPEDFKIENINKTKKTEATIDNLLDTFNYEDEDSKFLIKAWFYQTFFETGGMRPILALTGEPGTGKTILQRVLKGTLFGYERSEPNTMPEEEHAFTLMLKEYRYIFFDEVNHNNPAQHAQFRTLATGEEKIFRPKYGKSNVRFTPFARLCIASHDPKFREFDITQRLCLVKMLRPKKLRDESLILHELIPHRSLIWYGLIRDFQTILKNTKNNENFIPLTKPCRQLNLANFAWQAFPKEQEVCLRIFDNMTVNQSKFSSEFDPLMDLMDNVLTNNPHNITADGTLTMTAKQIHDLLWEEARNKNIKSVPVSVMGIAKWISKRKDILSEKFGMEVIHDVNINGKVYKFRATKNMGKEVF